jgi:hypothetical protein
MRSVTRDIADTVCNIALLIALSDERGGNAGNCLTSGETFSFRWL